jgi:hypothetical protein
MGSLTTVVIPSLPTAAASLETEICLLEGRDHIRMLLENSSLEGFRVRSNRFGDVCNFATHSGKTIGTQCGKPSFNCALRGAR